MHRAAVITSQPSAVSTMLPEKNISIISGLSSQAFLTDLPDHLFELLKMLLVVKEFTLFLADE